LGIFMATNSFIKFGLLLSILTLPHCGPRGVETSSRVTALFTLPTQQSPAGESVYRSGGLKMHQLWRTKGDHPRFFYPKFLALRSVDAPIPPGTRHWGRKNTDDTFARRFADVPFTSCCCVALSAPPGS
jgi:hypothetical protein